MRVVGYRPNTSTFASAQHTPLLQPTFLKSGLTLGPGPMPGQCTILTAPSGQQMVLDDSANVSLLNGQQVTPYQHSNGSGAQYETLSRMNARPLDSAPTVNLLNAAEHSDPLYVHIRLTYSVYTHAQSCQLLGRPIASGRIKLSTTHFDN